MRKLLLQAIGCILSLSLQAQVADSGDLEVEINSIKNNMPDSGVNNYVAPTAAQLSTWGNTLNLLIAKNYTEAEDSANTLDYDLIAFKDTTESGDPIYYMLKSTGTNYWGTYVYNPVYTRDIVIQSPHPDYDYNTHREGSYVFKKSGAMLFMMSGTHRCNDNDFSSCDGTTGVCNGGVSVAFQESDMAHVVGSVFQATTDSLMNNYSTLYFVQLHGFTKTASDPYVIMSNGTADTPSTDYIADLKNNLYAEDTSLTFKVAHLDSGWTRLVGFTNTQGRLINNSIDPCDDNPTGTTGRFLHIEQEKSKLRNDETGWAKMANAVTATFPLNALPIELIYFSVSELPDRKVQIRWQTASEQNNNYFTIERSSNGNEWHEIATVKGAGNSVNSLSYEHIDTKPLSGYSYYRLKQTDLDGMFTYSPVRVMYVKPELTVYPIPASNMVYMEIDNPADITRVLVINSSGVATLLNYTVVEGKLKANTSYLANGVYIIRIEGLFGVLTHKLVIDHQA